MAASEEFPRGWATTGITGFGGALVLTIPAVPGIIHVLDSATVSGMINAGAAVPLTVTGFIQENGITMDFLQLQFPVAPSVSSDSQTGPLASGMGNALVVTFAATPNVLLKAAISWHDI